MNPGEVQPLGKWGRTFGVKNASGGPLCFEIQFLRMGVPYWRSCVPFTALPDDGRDISIVVPWPHGADQTRTRVLYYDGEGDLPQGTAWTLSDVPAEAPPGGSLQIELSLHKVHEPCGEVQ